MKILFITLMLMFSTATFASGGHHHHDGEDGKDGVDGIDGQDGAVGIAGVNGLDARNGVSDNDFGTGVASLIALTNIDFSSSTQQWQVGVGLGTYDGEQALAFGVGKLVPKYDMLFKASGTVANSEMGIGVGLVWKIK